MKTKKSTHLPVTVSSFPKSTSSTSISSPTTFSAARVNHSVKCKRTLSYSKWSRWAWKNTRYAWTKHPLKSYRSHKRGIRGSRSRTSSWKMIQERRISSWISCDSWQARTRLRRSVSACLSSRLQKSCQMPMKISKISLHLWLISMLRDVNTLPNARLSKVARMSNSLWRWSRRLSMLLKSTKR